MRAPDLGCAFCPKVYNDHGTRNRHEASCPQRRGRPLPRRQQLIRQQAEQRVQDFVAQMQLDREWEPQLRALGLSTPQARHVIAKGQAMGLLPRRKIRQPRTDDPGYFCAFCGKGYGDSSSRLRHERKCEQRGDQPVPARRAEMIAEHEERVREIFKDYDPRRSVYSLLVAAGVTAGGRGRMTTTARRLGLIPAVLPKLPRAKSTTPREAKAPRPRPTLKPRTPSLRPGEFRILEPGQSRATPKASIYVEPEHVCDVCGYNAPNGYRLGKHKERCIDEGE